MKRLVLAGAGHAHALVLLQWLRQGLPAGADVTVVSPEPLAPYSGMVPGWLAGHYGFDDIVVDLAALAQAAGARWLQGEVQALDTAHRRLQLADGRVLDTELLSLNIGSTLRASAVPGAELLPLRPLALLRRRYEALLGRFEAESGTAPCTVTAVGGGAAGFEALLAVLQHLRWLRPDRVVNGRLVTRSAQLLPGLAPRARAAAERALDRAGVQRLTGHDWDAARDAGSDIVLWATGAEAHDWTRDAARRGGLAVDEAGFVGIDAQLRSTSQPWVFAAGDCARWPGPGQGLPKAGVHAVRMGPVLAHNLGVALSGGGDWRTHRPQRRFLTLLATGDGRAIAARGAFGAEGAWAWRWKRHIDEGFVARFRDAVLRARAGRPAR